MQHNILTSHNSLYNLNCGKMIYTAMYIGLPGFMLNFEITVCAFQEKSQ